MHTGLNHTAHMSNVRISLSRTVRNEWETVLHIFRGVNTTKLIHSLLHSTDTTLRDYQNNCVRGVSGKGGHRQDTDVDTNSRGHELGSYANRIDCCMCAVFVTLV